ncbi:hypothetical protein [Spirosoma areae]
MKTLFLSALLVFSALFSCDSNSVESIKTAKSRANARTTLENDASGQWKLHYATNTAYPYTYPQDCGTCCSASDVWLYMANGGTQYAYHTITNYNPCNTLSWSDFKSDFNGGGLAWETYPTFSSEYSGWVDSPYDGVDKLTIVRGVPNETSAIREVSVSFNSTKTIMYWTAPNYSATWIRASGGPSIP